MFDSLAFTLEVSLNMKTFSKFVGHILIQKSDGCNLLNVNVQSLAAADSGGFN